MDGYGQKAEQVRGGIPFGKGVGRNARSHAFKMVMMSHSVIYGKE